MNEIYRLTNVVFAEEVLCAQVFFAHDLIVDDSETADSCKNEVLCNLRP